MAQQKKSHKLDRNRKSGCNLAYKAEKRHEKSHIRRLKVHISKYGLHNDVKDALLRYAQNVGIAALNSANEFLKQVKQVQRA